MKSYKMEEMKNFFSNRIGLINPSLNDFENRKVKKNIEILRKIVEKLDLSLEQLLRVARYGELTNWLFNYGFKNKSSRELKNIIKEARISKYDIMDWDSNKREITRHVR